MSQTPSAARPRVVIACRVMQPELEAVRAGREDVQVVYLDQGLHRTPKKMPEAVQAEVDQAENRASSIVLGYGLCSNGLVGVRAPAQGLVVPRAHDCIALFLGSPADYAREFQAHPGTYYLTPGWVAEKKDPLGTIEYDYAPRLGLETAVWAMEEQLKNYTHITLILNGVGDAALLRARARENARFLKKEYLEIPGRLDYFNKLVRGPHDPAEFLFLAPGQAIAQEMFLDPGAL